MMMIPLQLLNSLAVTGCDFSNGKILNDNDSNSINCSINDDDDDDDDDDDGNDDDDDDGNDDDDHGNDDNNDDG